jgi:hypothetical protein
MGHRASVCYWIGKKGSVHYSHWGGLNTQLLHKIEEGRPFGGDKKEPEFISSFLNSFDNENIDGYLTKATSNTSVEPEKQYTVDSIEQWVESISALMMECAYLVDMSQNPWQVTAYAPIYWRGVDDLGDSGYVLVDKGEDAHANWRGIEAETWQDFLNQVRKEHREPDFIVQPE